MTLENGSVMNFGATLTAPPRVIHSAYSSPVTTRTDATSGNPIIEGLRIFKVGTFADSMGVVRSWESDQLDQMVAHFTLLKQGGQFPNVPIRADHSMSVDSIVGYFVSVYRDREDPNFLSADIEITEPDAFAKWQRGTYRSRSLEVGKYETNGDNPMAYFPVIYGLAFVDIPAVEGLHTKGTAPGTFAQAITDNPKENNVDHETFMRACAYAAWLDAANYAQACADWSSAATYAQAVQDHNDAATALGLQTGAPAAHAAPAATQVVRFSLNGQPVDMTVQEMGNQLGSLLTYRQETINLGRATYVDSLASHGKIGQPQVESLKTIVNGDPTKGIDPMTDAQFEAFKASYDAQGTAPLFGQYGQQSSGDNTGGTAQVQAASEVETLREIVLNHKRGGKTPEVIRNLPSYQKLIVLDPTAASLV